VPRLNEQVEVLRESGRHVRGPRQDPHLDVPLLGRLREVGGRYERLPVIDDDALRVQARAPSLVGAE